MASDPAARIFRRRVGRRRAGGVSVGRVAPGRVLEPSTGRSGGAEVAVPRPVAGERLAYLDNVKTLLIAGIIGAHAIQGYSEFGSWTYQDIQEVTLSPVVETISVIAIVSLGGGVPWVPAGGLKRGFRRSATSEVSRVWRGMPSVDTHAVSGTAWPAAPTEPDPSRVPAAPGEPRAGRFRRWCPRQCLVSGHS